MLRRACLLSLLLWPCVTPALALDLTVVLDGFDKTKGPLMLALFDRADAFDRAPDSQDQAVAAVRVFPGEDRVSVTLTGLPQGRYAAAAYQDSNGNGKLDTNVLGIPVKPYGFSATTTLGRPTFEAASKDSATGTLHVRIHE
jgi:uncharacterized protein (DUF2141 family)